MLTLCGFSASNYYNKVKLALLEKGVPFQEQLAWVGQTDLAASPLGKVPYLLTPEGPLCESAVIADYIEVAYPTPALVPAQAFAAAKVRELITFMELHLELVARNLYPQAFFGGTVSEAAREKVGIQLEKNIAAFAKLASFAPLRGGRQLQHGRLRRHRASAPGQLSHQGHLWPGLPGRTARARLPGPHGRAPARTAHQCRPQNQHGGDARAAQISRRLPSQRLFQVRWRRSLRRASKLTCVNTSITLQAHHEGVQSLSRS